VIMGEVPEILVLVHGGEARFAAPLQWGFNEKGLRESVPRLRKPARLPCG
jgi:hypothetical protein